MKLKTPISNDDPFQYNRREVYSSDEKLKEFASIAYRRCLDWFGPPVDPTWPTSIETGFQDACLRIPILCYYTIDIRVEHQNSDYRFQVLGHEMFHRFTFTRPGTCQAIWLKEMMADRTAQRLLKENGFEKYATWLERHYRLQKHITDLKLLSETRVQRVKILQRGYPDHFCETIFCLGNALEWLVGWRTLRSLTTLPDLDSWLHSLPASEREQVLALLNLDQMQGNRVTVHSEAHRDRLVAELESSKQGRVAFAYFLMGEFERAIRYCQEAIAQQPDNPYLYRYLSMFYLDREAHDLAIETLDQAHLLDPNSVWTLVNLHRMHNLKQHTDLAAGYARRVLELDPSNADVTPEAH